RRTETGDRQPARRTGTHADGARRGMVRQRGEPAPVCGQPAPTPPAPTGTDPAEPHPSVAVPGRCGDRTADRAGRRGAAWTRGGASVVGCAAIRSGAGGPHDLCVRFFAASRG